MAIPAWAEMNLLKEEHYPKYIDIICVQQSKCAFQWTDTEVTLPVLISGGPMSRTIL